MLRSDVRALFDAKVRSGLFTRCKAHRHAHVREDRYQDAIAMTWLFFVERAEAGEIPGDGLLFHYCALRLREPRPRFVRSGEPWMVDGCADLDDVHGRAARSFDIDATIDRTVAIRALFPEDRALLIARIDGDDLDTIAEAYGHSRSWASRRVQAVFDKLREHAG